MPAWNHTRSFWDEAAYTSYRHYVAAQAPRLRGHTGLDCADLSTMLLVRFAAGQGLPLVFTDMSDVHYDSRRDGQDPAGSFLSNKTWTDANSYLDAVVARIGTAALWVKNTEANPLGPEPGDLLMQYRGTIHHTALVFAVWLQGTPHPRLGDRSVIDFPSDQPGRDADEIAISQANTEYFRDRDSNSGMHFDYLNYRSRRKTAGAELIYFARVEPMLASGYQFRRWSLRVLTALQVPDSTGVPANVG